MLMGRDRPVGPKKDNNGFTIVELMIALSVLSTILVISTVILIQIGALYSKGVNAANLQNTTRSIMSDVTAALQFSGNTPSSCTPTATTCAAATSGSINAFCIGTTRYSYVLDAEMGTDTAANPITHAAAGASTPHVLWRDSIQQNAPCVPLNIAAPTVAADASSSDSVGGNSGGYDMVPDHMRLTRFKITPPATAGDTYVIDIWAAYGDSDLVVTSTSGPFIGQSTCNSGAGTQFCSVSQLSSAVMGRIY